MRSRRPRRAASASKSATPTLAAVRMAVRAAASAERALVNQSFFKTGQGDYGEGDKFLGVRVPALRRIARDARGLPHGDVLALLESAWHEERLLALLILVDAYALGDADLRRHIHRTYLDSVRHINNWDLVDASAEYVVGGHLDPARTALLNRLARSRNVWERRIAIVATFHFIKNRVFGPTFRLVEQLMADQHDLIQKAMGWMLREVGKRDAQALRTFLRRHQQQLPRTTLRYAIERFSPAERKRWLDGRG